MQTARRRIALILLVALSACTASPAPAADLTIFAAASLKDALDEVAAKFEAANPGVTIVRNYAGSNQLAAQINQGAPADVFASANPAQMGIVLSAGNVAPGADRVFARNRLVVIAPKDGRAPVASLQDLAKPGLKLVLADKSVPVGGYALDYLARASASPDFTRAYSAAVLANVVSYEDNVRSVLGKVALGEADAGIVYTTDLAGHAVDKVRRIDIPDALNVIAVYPIAPVKSSKQPALAQKFIDFVLSPEGQAILRARGFEPPGMAR